MIKKELFCKIKLVYHSIIRFKIFLNYFLRKIITTWAMVVAKLAELLFPTPKVPS